jgi:hypothetical protein
VFRLAFLGSLVSLALAGCHSGQAAAPSPAALTFARITAESGIRFQHDDGSSGRFYFPELMGPGCAFADFTSDGKPDLYLVNGARLPGAPPGPPIRDAFYRNNGDGTFTDATGASGLGDPRYGIGCCAGDYDNDGHLDLYITNLDRNTLYHNNGDGTFTDVTDKSGTGAGRFSTGCTFGDMDNDGDLDLFVCRYVVWSAEKNKICTVPQDGHQVRGQCRPVVYPADRSLLYRNNGNGTFTDVTAASGVGVPPGRALGAVWFDFDEDGDQDLYVSNDMTANFLFVNDGRGHFKEEAARRGVAVDELGRPQASMGLSVADFDGDGHLDLGVTNFADEYLALYRNTGTGEFEDWSARSGVTQATSRFVGFGVGLRDLDLDGLPDLFVANGHVSGALTNRMVEALSQPALCLTNDGRGGFIPVANAGAPVAERKVRRGAAFADLDGDGDLDLILGNWRSEPDLLRNDLNAPGRSRRHWIRLALEGKRCNRSGIGARVEVTAGARTQVQTVLSGDSYCSQSDLAPTFGLGDADRADRVRVRWPGGGESELKGLAADTTHHIKQE